MPKARRKRTGSPLARGRAGMARIHKLPDFVAPKVAAEIEAWLAASRHRTPPVAKDARSLSPRRAAVSWLSRRASRRRAVAQGAGGADAGGCARFSGGAAGRRHRQPLADAQPRRAARLRLAFWRRAAKAKSARSPRCARRKSARPCRGRFRSTPPSGLPVRISPRATAASRGFMPATPRRSACSMAAACAFPKRWGSSAAISAVAMR